MGGEHIEVTGIVQGVGFRPFVHRLATELGLVGHVGNDASKVFIDVAGPDQAIADLARRIEAEAPPLARIESVTRTQATVHANGFSIVPSRDGAGERTLVAPDTGICDDCRRELFDPGDRRYRHPFITCTNCGPRYTIISALPYDRPNTTMADFPMCDACAAEYEDPTDRRHHAQPIACHDCGPTLRYSRPGDPIRAAAADLLAGGVVAVKGLGGFHLAADATSDRAVGVLRDRKHRPEKPFAVMVRDLTVAEAVGEVDRSAALLLESPARPIVLVEGRPDAGLSELVAPGNPLVGLMLPYTPVHHLLLEAFEGPIVLTSANPSGAPLIHRDEDEGRLDGLADTVLTHDRRIHVPCDDSVVRPLEDRLLPIRRARGYAPVPVAADHGISVLAAGAELKNTACVASPGHAWVSQHIGDLESLETQEAFEATIAHLTELYAVEPGVVAADAHPAYRSSAWARDRHSDRLVEVQHHHAHVAALMAEHRLDPGVPVLGFAFDGTGYGTDGSIWGGEVLLADAGGFERVTHLAPIPLPGGDAAVRHPSRVALAHLHAAGIPWHSDLPPVAHHDATELGLLARQLETGFGTVPTTSMGRLFDAVASLLGHRHDISYEAQAAIDLEVAAAQGSDVFDLAFGLDGGLIDPGPVLRGLVERLRSGAAAADLALAFHVAVADAVAAVACSVGHDVVGLTGGVFQNALLTRLCLERLDGFDVRTHHVVPPNDGGLSLGQAFVAAHLRGGRPPG